MEHRRRDAVKILFCGDFISKNPENIILSEEFKNLMHESDLRCLNFEGAIALGEPVTIKGTAYLPQSIDSPAWCEKNGFNVISLANNHMVDYGQEALADTINAFKSSIITGAGDWEEAYQVKKVELNGLKIGFIALAQCEFGILNDNWSDRSLRGCAWINHSSVNSLIRDVKPGLDYLFIIAHTGVEYCAIPLPEWRDRYKELIDLGADAVIGGHPHVPQGWEVYKDKPIFYSLGNFFFDVNSEKEYWNNGLSVMLRIDKHGNLAYQVINPVKVNDEIRIDTSKQIQDHNELICRKLVDQEEYMTEVNKLCLDLWPSFEHTMLRALNSERSTLKFKNIIKYLLNTVKGRKVEYRYILNFLRCESARFVMVRAIKILSQVKI
jgi:poly-gamma-glutamate synthesis protein (capsule biosynthesis protein)